MSEEIKPCLNSRCSDWYDPTHKNNCRFYGDSGEKIYTCCDCYLPVRYQPEQQPEQEKSNMYKPCNNEYCNHYVPNKILPVEYGKDYPNHILNCGLFSTAVQPYKYCKHYQPEQQEGRFCNNCFAYLNSTYKAVCAGCYNFESWKPKQPEQPLGHGDFQEYLTACDFKIEIDRLDEMAIADKRMIYKRIGGMDERIDQLFARIEKLEKDCKKY